MDSDIPMQKIYITPTVPGSELPALRAQFEAFGPIKSCTTDPYETCVQYKNVDSAKAAMLNRFYCIGSDNMIIRWKPHILDLNVFCLLEVFEFLGLDDLCSLRVTCSKFKEIAERVFILKFASEVKIERNGMDTHQGMLRSFRHLIKSIVFEIDITYVPHMLAMGYVQDLIRRKCNDFSNSFCGKQLASDTQVPNLKYCTFVKTFGNQMVRTVEILHFFDVTDGSFTQKLQSSPDINEVSICVKDSLPPETISQLCRHVPKIEYLALYYISGTDFDINALRALKRLKVLNLSLCNATTESLKSLYDLNVTIEYLLIRGATIDDSFVSGITKLKQLKALVLIDDIDENRLVQMCEGLPKLVTLVVNKNISIDWLKKVVKGCPSLLTMEIKNLPPPVKYAKLKKLVTTTLKRIYLSSANLPEPVVYINNQIRFDESIPAFSYTLENMTSNIQHYNVV